MASYLQARQQQGLWYLRIDDIDPPREQAGASDQIIQSLSLHGFRWDGEVQYQSQHTSRYEHSLTRLADDNRVYYCNCSRKQIEQTQALASQTNKRIYPGTCRQRKVDDHGGFATRFEVTGKVRFDDLLQGHIEQDLEKEVGDFVIKRRDGLHSYQLANVVDDETAQITHIVRGMDLLDNTPRQIALIQALGFRIPGYAHVPLVVNAEGDKLSKQTHAAALDNSAVVSNLAHAWRFLSQGGVLSRIGESGTDKICDTAESFWEQAVRDWDIRRIDTQS